MIVATLPEPTVRPPSRYLNSVFRYISYICLAKLCIFSLVLAVLFLFARFLGTVLAPPTLFFGCITACLRVGGRTGNRRVKGNDKGLSKSTHKLLLYVSLLKAFKKEARRIQLP